jgi:ubiquinol-cytochrome c reductase cytochrome c subunit
VRRRVAGVLALAALFLLPAAALSLGGSGAAVASLPPEASSGRLAPPVLLQAPAPAANPDIRAGRVLYEERCATCHGERGQGVGGLGPSIAGLGPAVYDFMLSTGRMPIDRVVRQAARKPPSFDARQIAQLIAYLRTLPPGDGMPIPHPNPTFGHIADGQAVFQNNCAPCHGATGIGGAVGDVVAPALHQATATQIAEAVRIGPGAMPVFDRATIPDAELDSVIRYVLYLRHPQDRGGAGLAHVGPIVEGLVGLLAGLGAVVLVTRLIGERA